MHAGLTYRAAPLLLGDADVLASVDSAQWLTETLPNAKMVVLNGAGYVPIMTRPREFADEILSFFGAYSPQP